MEEIVHSKPWISNEDEAAVRAVLTSGILAQGACCPRFEEEMSQWLGVSNGVGVGCGGAAIELALRALDCGPDAEVILPTYVCRTVLDAVVAVGAKPVICDVGPNWVVQKSNISPHITMRTRAIIVPHMYGGYADIQTIRELGYPVIEDAAQALGSSAQHAIQGDLIVLSFHPTKCLTTGEGGMVLACDSTLIAKCRLGRDANESTLGRQFAPLSEIAAALGLSQLARYNEFLSRRRSIAHVYKNALKGQTGIEQDTTNPIDTMYFRFPLHRTGGVDRCQEAFRRHGIHVRRGVDRLLHRLMGTPDSEFPTAVAHFSTTVSLPIYPALHPHEIETCARAIAAIL